MPATLTDRGLKRWASFIPRPTDRAVLVGQTGSGKTTLARYLLEARPYVIVVDPKGTLCRNPAWSMWPAFFSQDALAQCDPVQFPRMIYVPSPEELIDPWALDPLWRWVYARGRTTVYVDETYAVTAGDQYPVGFGACLTRGRERQVEVWCGTQRPTRIPQVVLSESENLYVFRLQLPQDRKKVTDISGIRANRIAALKKWQFLFCRAEDSEAQGPLRLTLKQGG